MSGADGVQDAEKTAAGRGLDWLNLFVANVQTGFGPFISVYLTTVGWTQTAIGIALSVGTVAAMISQLPAGALVDAIRSKTLVAFFSIVAFTTSAIMFTIAPIPLFIYLAEILHSFSSCTFGLAIAAISLRITGDNELGVRLGRNARYASIGNAMGAALMGAAGYYISERSVFLMTAALTLPALVALLPIGRYEQWVLVGVAAARSSPAPIRRVLGDRRLLFFALCAALFTFANAALLPLASVGITKVSRQYATLIIAAAIVLPQLTVALISPSIGHSAERLGRHPVLILGFSVVPLRAGLLAATSDPMLILAIQVLDGIAAASFGVMVPLVISDIARGTGHFNVALGFVGFAIGIGATLSTTAGGWLADHFGEPAAFLCFGVVGIVGLVLVSLMVETRPQRRADDQISP